LPKKGQFPHTFLLQPEIACYEKGKKLNFLNQNCFGISEGLKKASTSHPYINYQAGTNLKQKQKEENKKYHLKKAFYSLKFGGAKKLNPLIFPLC
jgi:hypothetical protein